MDNLGSVAEALRSLRREAGLSQSELSARADVARVTLTRMENVTQGDMSVSTLLRLLAAMGHELVVRPVDHQRTLDDVRAEQQQRWARDLGE